MKKVTFFRFKETLKKTGKFILGAGIALLFCYLLYPKFSQIEVETKVIVTDRIGDYVYYKIPGFNEIYNKTMKEPYNVGDTFTMKIKTKDHPKYKDDNKIGGMGALIIGYSIFVIIVAYFVYAIKRDENELSWGGLGYSIVAVPTQIWLFLIITVL